MRLTSPVFKDQDQIPVRYTGEGEDVSPPLEWSDVPEGCRSFVLLCQDPDAPARPGGEHPFVHWLIYNLSPATTALPPGLPRQEFFDLPVIATQGRNSFGQLGYGGPMPPLGHGAHHYEFTLYALNENFRMASGMRRDAVLSIIQGFVLAEAKLTGTYERQAPEARKSA
jgi:Raf kinase inhibitor-like YbhB/YbcL family protein